MRDKVVGSTASRGTYINECTGADEPVTDEQSRRLGCVVPRSATAGQSTSGGPRTRGNVGGHQQSRRRRVSGSTCDARLSATKQEKSSQHTRGNSLSSRPRTGFWLPPSSDGTERAERTTPLIPDRRSLTGRAEGGEPIALRCAPPVRYPARTSV
jgi:hypothetical protein